MDFSRRRPASNFVSGGARASGWLVEKEEDLIQLLASDPQQNEHGSIWQQCQRSVSSLSSLVKYLFPLSAVQLVSSRPDVPHNVINLFVFPASVANCLRVLTAYAHKRRIHQFSGILSPQRQPRTAYHLRASCGRRSRRKRTRLPRVSSTSLTALSRLAFRYPWPSAYPLTGLQSSETISLLVDKPSPNPPSLLPNPRSSFPLPELLHFRLLQTHHLSSEQKFRN